MWQSSKIAGMPHAVDFCAVCGVFFHRIAGTLLRRGIFDYHSLGFGIDVS
jgi:hypothetical protein